MHDIPGAAPKRLTLSRATDGALTKLGAQAAGAGYLLVLVGLGLLSGGHGSPALWPVVWALVAATLAGYAVFLLHLRRTVAQGLALDGAQPRYDAQLSHLLQPRANASALHAGLVLAGIGLAAAARLSSSTLNALRPMLWPFGEYLGLKARLARTRWRGHSFALVGPFGPYLRLCALQAVLGVLTLGVLYADYAVRKRRYLFAQLRWAGHVGHYDGDEAEARRLYMRGLGLCVVTLGIYTPWFLVQLRNYHLSRLSLGGLRLVCTQSGASFATLSATCYLANVASLGLACGWSYARRLRYQVDHLHFVGELPAPLPDAPGSALEADGMGPSDLLSGVWTFES